MSSSAFSLDYLPPSELRWCVRCRFCDAVIAVRVPCSSLSKKVTVTVRCGHCTNQITVNVPGLPSPAAHQRNFGHSFLSPSHNLLEEVPAPPPIDHCNPSESVISTVRSDEPPKVPAINRPPEKRQKAPSAYNRFVKDEIQRIKAGNPDITHRMAFSAAAKNWAPYSQNHFGHLPDQAVSSSVRQQEGEDQGRTHVMDTRAPGKFLDVLTSAMAHASVDGWMPNPVPPPCTSPHI